MVIFVGIVRQLTLFMLACVLAGVDEVKDVFGVMADCGGMV
jgi:hypothetical protein